MSKWNTVFLGIAHIWLLCCSLELSPLWKEVEKKLIIGNKGRETYPKPPVPVCESILSSLLPPPWVYFFDLPKKAIVLDSLVNVLTPWFEIGGRWFIDHPPFTYTTDFVFLLHTGIRNYLFMQIKTKCTIYYARRINCTILMFIIDVYRMFGVWRDYFKSIIFLWTDNQGLINAGY